MFRSWRSKNINVPWHTSCNSLVQTSCYCPDKRCHCFQSFLLGRASFHLFRDSLQKRSCPKVKGLKGYRCLVGPFIMLHQCVLYPDQIRPACLAAAARELEEVEHLLIHQSKQERCDGISSISRRLNSVECKIQLFLLFFLPPTHCETSEKKVPCLTIS